MARLMRISFATYENDLYKWVVSKTTAKGDRLYGFSELMKELLWAAYIAEVLETELDSKIIKLVRSVREDSKCGSCGGPLRIRTVTDLAGKKMLRLFCHTCKELHQIDLSELLKTKTGEEGDDFARQKNEPSNPELISKFRILGV
jgi:hypothetical protein